MSKPVIPFVETMASYACNLSCLGCTNYSDLNFKGHVAWNECKTWLEGWLEKVDIPDFGIIGGEPLANPDIFSWIVGARQLMPDSQIRFTTNGILLEKKFDVVDGLHSIGNSVFKITVHKSTPELENIIEKILKTYKFEEVEEFGIRRYKTSNNFRFQINRPEVFVKTYKNNYRNMMPHNNNPQKAFDLCVQKTCPLLYKGSIYKCSSIAILEDTLKKFARQDLPDWQKYVNYKGISLTSSDHEIKKFIDSFGKAENICSMCPTVNDTDSFVDHKNNIEKTNELVPEI